MTVLVCASSECALLASERTEQTLFCHAYGSSRFEISLCRIDRYSLEINTKVYGDGSENFKHFFSLKDEQRLETKLKLR